MKLTSLYYLYFKEVWNTNMQKENIDSMKKKNDQKLELEDEGKINLG